jgi:hypothetical protein
MNNSCLQIFKESFCNKIEKQNICVASKISIKKNLSFFK